MSRTAKHTLLVAGALAALLAAAAVVPTWAEEQYADLDTTDVIGGSDAGDDADRSWSDGGPAIHVHHHTHHNSVIEVSVVTGPTRRVFEDERERVSMNGGRRL
jgi:hypothetical protein